ncbi:glycosyltransferase family 4 protein [Svornostia abyssi]|uniref:Glycosyltransferase family 4 protein n=1 Tax=Svornostia abyssi TaxID=2898438 RepID=A0ABY5PMA7_9ACTN|nr:glycosyltransferase family 4 protein [Parviterribacteraceae bacterium J379]
MPQRLVAIDLRIADRVGAEHTGVGRYAVECARALVDARPEWRFRLLTNRPELVADRDAEVRRTRWPTHMSAGRVAWLHGPAAASHRALDGWLGTAFTLPPFTHLPSVVAVHDLFFLTRRAEYGGWVNARYATAATRRATRRAGMIVTGSTRTQTELREHFGADPAKVDVVPYGVAAPFFRERRPADPPFLLAVGTWEPRKGLSTMLAALDAVNARRDTPVRLVLAGAPGWGVDDLVARLRAHPHADLRTGVGDDELASLYAGAAALVLASEDEGFGLPAAEAFAAGCPVIATDLPAVREFAGDAARYVPQRDPSALAAAMAEVLATGDEPERERTARAVAAGLTWEAHGRRVAELLERVMR